jgi:Ca-activated chloride channel family protein
MIALVRRLGALVVAAGMLAACGSSSSSGGASDPATTLTVVAGSELKDLEPYFGQIRDATGVTIAPVYSGTLAAIDRIDAGEHFDAAWFSTAKYLVLRDTAHRIKAQHPTMLSPVIVGVKESKAKAFGWLPPATVSWRAIAAKAGTGDFRYAMTNPTSSNSGFSAVIAIATAFSGSGDALDTKRVDTPALQRFFHGQKLVSGSSGWLSDAYVRDQDSLDGIVSYEASIVELDANPDLREKLVPIYPSDGVVTADYPLVLLDAEKQALYDKVVTYVTSAPFQDIVARKTFRRPIVADAALPPELPKRTIVDVPFPGSIRTVDAILASYLDVDRTPSHPFFIIDTSGSMQGARIEAVRAAIDGLAGDDTSLTGKFARFEAREKITFSHFASTVSPPVDFAMAAANDTATLANIKRYVADLRPDGGTAIYSAVESTLDAAYAAEQREPNRYYTVVLMTDGENNEGDNVTDFKRRYASLPQAERAIRVFPILFGEGSSAELDDLAQTTGGRVFDGRSAALTAIFKEIRGYQ